MYRYVCVFLLVVASALSTQARADLIGSQVTTNLRIPTIEQVQSNTAIATVGPGVEYPEGTFTTLSSPYFTIPVDIDLAATTITATYVADVLSAPGAFNGYVFDFSNLSQSILAATLDPLSSFTSGQVRVGFTSSEVTVNIPNLFVHSGDKIIVDLTFAEEPPPASPVPEPASIILLGTGVVAIWHSRRRWMNGHI